MGSNLGIGGVSQSPLRGLFWTWLSAVLGSRALVPTLRALVGPSCPWEASGAQPAVFSLPLGSTERERRVPSGRCGLCRQPRSCHLSEHPAHTRQPSQPRPRQRLSLLCCPWGSVGIFCECISTESAVCLASICDQTTLGSSVDGRQGCSWPELERAVGDVGRVCADVSPLCSRVCAEEQRGRWVCSFQKSATLFAKWSHCFVRCWGVLRSRPRVRALTAVASPCAFGASLLPGADLLPDEGLFGPSAGFLVRWSWFPLLLNFELRKPFVTQWPAGTSSRR